MKNVLILLITLFSFVGLTAQSAVQPKDTIVFTELIPGIWMSSVYVPDDSITQYGSIYFIPMSAFGQDQSGCRCIARLETRTVENVNTYLTLYCDVDRYTPRRKLSDAELESTYADLCNYVISEALKAGDTFYRVRCDNPESDRFVIIKK